MPSIEKCRLVCAALDECDSSRRQQILHQIFDGYNASSDFPGMAFVDDLLDMYPTAKVILNQRQSAEDWERSVRQSLRFFSTRWYHLLTIWIPVCYWHHKLYRAYMRLAKRRFDVDDIFTTTCYERHNEWVRSVAATRGKPVLEWAPEDGWKPLCTVVARPVPDQKFPRTNEGAEIKKLTAVLVKQGIQIWMKILAFVCFGIVIFVFVYQWYLT